MDRSSSESSSVRKTSTSSRNSSISSQVSEYSLLILSLDQTSVPFTPVEWCTDPFPVSKHWSQISDLQKAKLVSSHAVDLFRENQSQHGTNVVVRMDLQYNQLTDQYSSTSIAQLPDGDSQTPDLIQTTVPGGASALTKMLTALGGRKNDDEIRQIVGEVLDLGDNEGIAAYSKRKIGGQDSILPTGIVAS